MKILRANSYFDIFQGDGWENHTRVQRLKDKHTGQYTYKYISGNKVHPKFIEQLLKDIK